MDCEPLQVSTGSGVSERISADGLTTFGILPDYNLLIIIPQAGM